jgi:hypothetical protein
MPRFQISFVLDDKSLTHDVPTPAGVSNDGTAEASPWSRKGQGEMVLTFCKVDNLTIAATSGRSVVANRWEGLAEGIQYVNRTDPIQDQSILDTTYAGNLNGALLQSTDFQPFAWGTATGTNPINNA